MSLGYRVAQTVSLVMLGMVGLFGCGNKNSSSVVFTQLTTMEGVEGCEGAVLPNPTTIESGEYSPLSRPLFIYVNTKSLQKPEVAGYVKTILNEAHTVVDKAGFIKLNSKVMKEQQDKLNAAIADVKIPEKLETGTVVIDGSSTVFPFSVAAAELFQKANDDKVHVNVGKKGTGGGFKRFCAGETDISNASRPILPAEVAKAKENGVEFIELTVCIDGLSVCVNPKNDWCNCLSVEQLKAIWSPDSKIEKWNQLNPAWPDAEIKLYGADTDSGTFDYFTEVIVGKLKSSRTKYTASSEDNVLVKGVAGDKYSLGYFGYSYYDSNRKTLKVLGIKSAAKKSEEKKSTDPKSEEKKAEVKEKKEEKK
ncbi:MAG: phosphate binding protein [Planctomycetaceae bacterium]|nr:phosphate binding protein [Planctomycetaceae bacterium]